MNYLRYRYRGKVMTGVEESGAVRALRMGPCDECVETDPPVGLDQVEILCPSEPTKILAVGLNYGSHLDHHAPGTSAPASPEVFFKPPSALLPHGGVIRIPPDAHDVHYEGELVIVIGGMARQVSPGEAENYILGYSCGIDVSARIWQKNDLQWWRAKGCDTFAPAGPVVAANFDWRNGGIETRVNGGVVQSGRFSEFLFDPPMIVSYASRYLTLMPGDLIYTGTPGGTGALHPGDRVEVEIPGIGTLCSSVAAGA